MQTIYKVIGIHFFHYHIGKTFDTEGLRFAYDHYREDMSKRDYRHLLKFRLRNIKRARK